MDELLDLAASQGFKVEYVSMSKYSGLLLDDTILINKNRESLTQRVALAHELGHIHYGHDWRLNPHSMERDEYQANRFAGKLLINEERFAQASRASSDLRAVAKDLNVPVRILEMWLSQRPHDAVAV